jgi:hypothetical protein
MAPWTCCLADVYNQRLNIAAAAHYLPPSVQLMEPPSAAESALFPSLRLRLRLRLLLLHRHESRHQTRESAQTIH